MMANRALQAVMVATTTIHVDPPGGTHMPKDSPLPGPLPGPGHPATPHVIFQHATGVSCIMFWVLFGVFAAGMCGAGWLATRVERRVRIFHVLSAVALAITATGYLALATGVGTGSFHRGGRFHGGHGGKHRHHGGHGGHKHPKDPKHPADPEPYELVTDLLVTVVHHATTHLVRQHMWLRDLVHIATVPIYVIMLGVLSGMPPVATVWAAFSSALSCTAKLFGGHFAAGQRGRMRGGFIAWLVWGLFWASLLIIYLGLSGCRSVHLRPRQTQGRFYLLFGLFLTANVLVAIFTIVGPGLGLLSVDGETIAVGITEVAGQLGFVYFLLLTHVHGDEDDTFTFPAWLSEARPDERGLYERVATSPEN